MSKLKVGDRVVIYDNGIRSLGIVADAKTHLRGCIAVRVGGVDPTIEVHERQCRKLVKRERRRVFINSKELEVALRDPSDSAPAWKETWQDDSIGGHWVEFREVRRK